jgi:hypothetical protein
LRSTAATKSDLDSLRSALTAMPWIPWFTPPGPSKPWDDLRASVSPYGLDKWPCLTAGPIIWLLTVRPGGNVHAKQIVDVIFSSRCSCADNHPQNIADWSSDGHTGDFTNSWLGYDFKARSVQITHYSIRSCSWCFPRSWVVEGLPTSSGTWVELDSRSGNSQLNGQYIVATFPIKDSSTGRQYRCIRLRQTGPTHDNHNYLRIAGLEVFGHLYA